MPSIYKREFPMSKNKSSQAEEKKEEEKTSTNVAKSKTNNLHYSKIVVRIFMWLIFLAILLGLWLNPEVIESGLNSFQQQSQQPQTQQQSTINESTPDQLSQQIDSIKTEIQIIKQNALNQNTGEVNKEDLKNLNARINNFETQNIALIEKKADKDSLLGLINRLDKIEQRLDNMAKISDQGALILSTTMMIKDSASRGNSYEYEAEMLSQLAQKEPQISDSVRTLANMSQLKISSSTELQKSFKKIYEEVEKAEQARQTENKNWKERLNMKIKEYIQVKRLKEQDSTPQPISPEEIQKNMLQQAQEEVSTKHFDKAIHTLNNMPELLQRYTALQNWIGQAQKNVVFNQAINQISTYSLALMKLNYVHPQTAEQQ